MQIPVEYRSLWSTDPTNPENIFWIMQINAAPIRQHELDHTDHTDQEEIDLSALNGLYHEAGVICRRFGDDLSAVC